MEIYKKNFQKAKGEKMRKTKLICFIGIDGSGKSTLSRYLSKELKKRNYNATYIWWLEGENSLIRRILRIVKKSSPKLEKDINSNIRNKRTTEKLFRILYPRIVLLDYLRFGITKVLLPKIINKNEVIILDRFMYDVILAISEEFNYPDSKRSKLFRLCKLLPDPDLIFIIDVPPEVSFLRKKSELKSIINAKMMWKKYQELYSLLNNLSSGKIVRIDNTQEVETVKAEILRITLDFLRAGKNGK